MTNVMSNFKHGLLQWFNHSRAQSIDLQSRTILTLACYAGAALLLAIVAYASAGYHWAFMSINAQATWIPAPVLHHITVFGDGALVLSLMLYIAHKNVPILLSTLVAGIAGGIVSQVLKNYFNASRPPGVLDHELFNLIGKAYTTRSFPSGHTLTAFLTASVLICFADKTTTKVLLFCLATLVGLSRVWLGVHWPIDVLVGSALGTLCGVGAYFFARKFSASLHIGWIIFIFALLVFSAISALVTPNDYYYAQLLIYLVALLAVYKTIKLFISFAATSTSSTRWVAPHKSTSTLDQLNNPSFLFFVILIAVTAYRILVIGQEHVTLFYDEAYYYHWSLAPDLGYYSKPPMVAWVIHLTTTIVGDTVLGIKLGAPLLYGAAAYFIFRCTQLAGNSTNGAIAGLVFLTAPVVGFNSEFITTDAPLLFYWALSFYLFVLAVHKNSSMYWLALGISTGLGMLSKYTMALLPASLFLFLLVSAQHRNLLASYKPWLAALVAGALFSVNLWWNSQHEWIAFAHTQEISKQNENSFNIAALVEFIAAQAFVLGPLWLWAVWRIIRQKTIRTKPQFEFAIPAAIYATFGILIVIGIQALTSRAFPNWAAPWIVGASILIGLGLNFRIENTRLIRTACIAHLGLLSAFYHWPMLLDVLHVESTRKNNPYQRVEGWEEVAQKLQPVIQRYPNAILASDSRDLIAYLGFHAMPGALNFARWNSEEQNIRDHYDLKFNLRGFAGKDKEFIYVAKKPLTPQKLTRFYSAKSLATIQETVFSDLQHTIYVYHLSGFKGY